MLGQDYVLKQFLSSLSYPESPLGKRYWKKVYEEVYQLASTTNIPINTFNKVWIVPERAHIYEHGNLAVIAYADLKAMHEEDYLALKKGTKSQISDQTEKINKVASDVMKEIILPEIDRDVNYGENFAQLRQMYHSFILASWFKEKLKDSVFQYYIDQKKTEGIDLEDEQAKDTIFNLYVEAYKKGVYNYIRDDYDQNEGKQISRQYYSGGLAWTAKNVSSSAVNTATVAKPINRKRSRKVRGRLRTVSPKQPKEAAPFDIPPDWRAVARGRVKTILGLGIFLRELEDVYQSIYAAFRELQEGNGKELSRDELRRTASRATYQITSRAKREKDKVRESAEARIGDLRFIEADSLGERIAMMREDMGLSRKELAKKLRIDVSTISYWENDRKVPSPKNMEKLALVLDTSISHLLAGMPREELMQIRIENDHDLTYRQLLGAKIKVLRYERGLTQTQLAKNSGVSLTFMNNLEQGKNIAEGNSHIDRIKKIAEAFEESFEELEERVNKGLPITVRRYGREALLLRELEAIRVKRGLSKAELARKMDMKGPTLWTWLQDGQARTEIKRINMVDRISGNLGTTYAELLGATKEEQAVDVSHLALSSSPSTMVDGQTTGGIDFDPANLNLNVEADIFFALPLETIRKFQTSTGMTFQILTIEKDIDLDTLLEVKKN